MKRIIQRILSGIGLTALLTIPALASTITASDTAITLPSGGGTFSVTLAMTSDAPFAGAEFSLDTSDGLTIDELTLVGIASHAAQVSADANGQQHIGFFASTNQFDASSPEDVLTLTCHYSGSTTGEILLTGVNIITVDTTSKTTQSEQLIDVLTVTVTPECDTTGGGSTGGTGGGSAGGGDTSSDVGDTTITEEETPLGQLELWQNPFSDVAPEAWYYPSVGFVVQNGLFTGTSATTFEPNAVMTRAMLVTVLHRMDGAPTVDTTPPFEDVPHDSWYTQAVAWASHHGIVTGFSEAVFAPNQPITREQMATILHRYASYHGVDTSTTADLSPYTDATDIGQYAREAMMWANGIGLITGTTEHTLSPLNSATRAEVATILMRYLSSVQE